MWSWELGEKSHTLWALGHFSWEKEQRLRETQIYTTWTRLLHRATYIAKVWGMRTGRADWNRVPSCWGHVHHRCCLRGAGHGRGLLQIFAERRLCRDKAQGHPQSSATAMEHKTFRNKNTQIFLREKILHKHLLINVEVRRNLIWLVCLSNIPHVFTVITYTLCCSLMLLQNYLPCMNCVLFIQLSWAKQSFLLCLAQSWWVHYN